MELLRKFRAFLSDPREKLWWLSHRVGEVTILAKRGRFGALVAYFVAAVTGWRPYDLYLDYLSRRHDGTIRREIRGNAMELNLADRGLSRDLFLYGVREERGIEIFQRELERLRPDVEDGVVLDVGANIGYFALMELDALGDSAEVVAFEPDERNVALLERNLALHGYHDAATVERAAVGPERGTAELELSSHTNLNNLRCLPTEPAGIDVLETETVDVWSIDEYLAAHDLDPESVVAVRMDLEGYEIEVADGMERVLSADGPLVLSIEIHTVVREPEEIRRLLDRFEEHGFEVVEALTEFITVDPVVGTSDVEEMADLPDSGPTYNLILRKAGASEERPETVREGDVAPPG